MHAQGIGDGVSGWVAPDNGFSGDDPRTIPEPGLLGLLGIAAVQAYRFRRRATR